DLFRLLPEDGNPAKACPRKQGRKSPEKAEKFKPDPYKLISCKYYPLKIINLKIISIGRAFLAPTS
ncbi:MAG: hypothetical protein OXJ52_02075, partial [Oligoflexia bacterium]|nr:hypothetical protein [Oligoflexia bacterium]